MIHGKVSSLTGTLYFKKEHKCPKCKTTMEAITVKKVVNSNSPEAKQYDFRLRRGVYLKGNIEFSWKELKCPACGAQFTMEQMQKIEFESLDPEQKIKQEKKEKLKVALFGLAMIVFVVIVIVCAFSK